ncbi:MAG TPA: PfkB family carbohydrate kinase [Thermomicrobiales bacterium]|nr:PfkB family carbohydrate kinase [Thermomicrobiales bacterium]
MDATDLDVLSLGMMMGEAAPPRAGLTLGDAGGLTLFPSGSATIFAIALAKLGSRVGIVSRVGDDDLGHWMRGEVERAGIDAAGVAAVGGQLTPLALASVDEAGRKRFAYYRFAGRCDPLATLRAADVPDALLRRARVFDIGEASLRNPDLRSEALALMRRAREFSLAICYAPNYRESAWAGGAAEAAAAQRTAVALADIALMNLEEARLIAGTPSVDAAEAARAIVALGPAVVAVTDGAAGAIVATPEQVARVPAIPVSVVFDIGAGDAFHAGFLAAWRPGADPL